MTKREMQRIAIEELGNIRRNLGPDYCQEKGRDCDDCYYYCLACRGLRVSFDRRVVTVRERKVLR